jgi:hypothetical protein
MRNTVIEKIIEQEYALKREKLRNSCSTTNRDIFKRVSERPEPKVGQWKRKMSPHPLSNPATPPALSAQSRTQWVAAALEIFHRIHANSA